MKPTRTMSSPASVTMGRVISQLLVAHSGPRSRTTCRGSCAGKAVRSAESAGRAGVAVGRTAARRDDEDLFADRQAGRDLGEGVTLDADLHRHGLLRAAVNDGDDVLATGALH